MDDTRGREKNRENQFVQLNTVPVGYTVILNELLLPFIFTILSPIYSIFSFSVSFVGREGGKGRSQHC